MEALQRLLNGDAWLISFTVACKKVKLTCEFFNQGSDEIDCQKTLSFEEVSHLNLIYKQNVFGSEENDISTIDMSQICKEETAGSQGRWRIIFELTYGSLEFSFGSLEITDLPK